MRVITQRLRNLLLGSVTQLSNKSAKGDTRRMLIQGTDLIGTFEFQDRRNQRDEGDDWKIVALESVTGEEERELELQRLTAAFDEWKKLSTASPALFAEPSENYGRECAKYFMRLCDRLSQPDPAPAPMPVVEIAIPE